MLSTLKMFFSSLIRPHLPHIDRVKRPLSLVHCVVLGIGKDPGASPVSVPLDPWVTTGVAQDQAGQLGRGVVDHWTWLHWTDLDQPPHAGPHLLLQPPAQPLLCCHHLCNRGEEGGR